MKVVCNICGGSDFTDIGNRKNARCVSCGSFERTRLLWLYLLRAGLSEGHRVMHLAPELGLANAILQRVGRNSYFPFDFEPERFKLPVEVEFLDLTDLDQVETGSYDFIVHSHVLEHIPRNIAYVLYHLHRMLKQSGKHIMCVPFMPGRFGEDFGIDAAERTMRFGQEDHVRRFGSDDISSHIGSVVDLSGSPTALDFLTEHELESAAIPAREYKGFTGSTILSLERYRYLLGALP